MQNETRLHPLRAIVAAVHLPNVTDTEFESSLTELRELAKTLGYQVVGTFIQKRARFDAAAYLGIGKQQEMRASSKASTLRMTMCLTRMSRSPERKRANLTPQPARHDT